MENSPYPALSVEEILPVFVQSNDLMDGDAAVCPNQIFERIIRSIILSSRSLMAVRASCTFKMFVTPNN